MTSLSATWGRDARVIGLVCLPHMMSHFYYTVLPPMAVALTAAFGISYFEFGTILTSFALAAGISQTPVGFLVDRIGGRPVLIAGVAMEACAIGAIGLADSYWQLIALGLIAGFGHTVFHPADYSILAAGVTRERLGRAFAFHSFSGYLGFASAPLFMTLLTEYLDWRAAFLLAGALGLFSGLVVLLSGNLLNDDMRHRIERRSIRSETGEKARHGETARGVKLLFSVPILMCFLYFVLHQLGGGGLRTFLPAALKEMYGTELSAGGLALSIFMLGTAAGILAGGFLADRIGPRIGTAAITLIPAGLMIALMGWYDLPLPKLIVALAAAGCLIGILIPSRDLLLRSVTPEGSMGKVMGFTSTGANVGGALIPMILGHIMDLKAFSWIFWISAIFIGAAFLTFSTVRGKYSADR